MPLQFQFFRVPTWPDEASETSLNGFLASVRVLTVHREFVCQGDKSFWSFCVEYMPGGGASDAFDAKKPVKKRVDYKDVLSPEDFALFVKLREWRKEAAALEAVPVYTIFTNEQLAQIARNRVDTMDALMTIDGIGEARAKKYGRAIIEMVLSIPGVSSVDEGI